MQGIVRLGRPLRIVIYNDALIPGSPFRPDKGRVVETFYWCMVDWPDHVLQRSFCWPVFAVIRKSLVAKILGGLSAVAGFVLIRFTRLFTVGVRLPLEQSIIVCGVFVGWLAGLGGHKELTCWKGHNGTRACMCCKNLKQPGSLVVGEIDLSCADATQFEKHTSADIFKIVDDLDRDKATMSKTAHGKRETQKGFSADVYGIMWCHAFRTWYQPVDHHLRDWMHMVASDGVANTEICALSV